MGFDFIKLVSRVIFTCCFLFFLFTISISLASPPPQPTEGPGGSSYYHNKVITNKYGFGSKGYYLFEPDEPRLSIAPVIIFFHGFTAITPTPYEAWIEHIVKKGNIVIFPVYQRWIIDSTLLFTSNTIKAITDAIEELEAGDHVKPDLEKFATVGHSMGGVLAANVAALAKESGLPQVKAVMSVEPGVHPIPRLEDLSKIPEDTLLLSIVGDADSLVGKKDAKHIYKDTTQIPADNKDFVIMESDRNGIYSLTANHFAPVAVKNSLIPGFGVDALDYYCLWKLFDALTDAAFYGTNQEYALGNTFQQRYMGEWSDGTPVKELTVTDNP